MPNANPTACLLVIGNEVLSGRTQDANIRFLALGLVLCKIGVALCWLGCIETNGHVRWFLVVDQFNDGIGKTKLRIGIFSL